MQGVNVSRERSPLAIVTLNRPHKRNAVSLEMWHQLAREFQSLAQDDSVRAVVLTGAGGHFCAGADIGEFGDARHDSESGARYERAVDAAVEAIMSAPKPTIAAVEGYCLGGGCSLAMACDFRLAHRDAVFGIPAARLGVVYGALDTRNLVSLVGVTHAKRILFSACHFGAGEALDIGFVDAVDAKSALDAACAWMEDIAANAPLSIAGAKRVLAVIQSEISESACVAIEKITTASLESADYREGVRAFVEKRTPIFTGK